MLVFKYGILVWYSTVLYSSVVSGLMIKEFCGGSAGWNDRADFSETNLKPAS